MQKRKCFQAVFLALTLAVLGGPAASAQTDVALSLYGAFSGATTGNGVTESPSNAAGGLLELRHISSPLLGYEATYAFNRANQVYSASSYACPVGVVPPCPPPSAAVSANAHELTVDWLASVHVARFRPFVLAGVGLLLNEPSGGQSNTTSSDKPAFVYGAGLDWGLLPHIGLRLQYRGNVYKAPDVTTLFTSTGAFTHTAEPAIGFYFRF